MEIDRAKTRAYYERHHLITDDCTCPDCRNYVQACGDFPAKVLQFFDSLGIIPAKEGEVYESRLEDGTSLYGGFYHVVGRIVTGPDCWAALAAVAPNLRKQDQDCMFTIEDFSFGFTHQLGLVPKDFPEPVLQLEFLARLPWVID